MKKKVFPTLRDIALYEAYKKAFRIAHSHKEAIDIAINSAAPHFFCSQQWAYKTILCLLRGEHLPTDTNRQQEYYDIFRKFRTLSRLPRYQGMSVKTIVSHAVAEPAPRFYIANTNAEQIICRMRRYYQAGHANS